LAHPRSFAAEHSGTCEELGITLVFSGECFGDELPFERHAGDEAPASWVARRYAEQGDRFVASLNGLFSGLLIDHRRRRAFLFNDRYGLERIYVHDDQGNTYFASEAKALLQVVPGLRTFDETGVSQYLAYGCTLGPTTLFRGVSLLPSASVWVHEPVTKWQKKTYFSPREWEAQEPLSQSQFESAFADTFRCILPQYVTEPDRLGIALTGGLDTRMIMACLPEATTKPTTYTFSGRTENILDGKLAARIARSCGMSHHLLRIGEDFLMNFGEMVDRSVYISDGCCGATGAHELYFNRAAAKLAPIRLTGNFGSEVLRSVSTFKPSNLQRGLLSPDMQSAVATTCAARSLAAENPVTFAAFQEIPWNLIGTLLTGRSQVAFRTPYLDNELVALAYRAPAVARTSSTSALRFIERANPELSRIPTDRGHIGTIRGPAWLVRRVFAEVTFKIDYLRTEGLPGALAPLSPLLDALVPTGILGLHKFLPYSNWFRRELCPYLHEVITNSHRRLPFIASAFLEPMLQAHCSGRKNHTREINTILTLESIDRLLIKSRT
jgi:asparagine synthase (glutamine-hydrolysing)